MAPRKPSTKPEFSPHTPDASRDQPAAHAASSEILAAGASSQGRATDEPPRMTSETVAPATTAGATRTSGAEIEHQQPETVTVSFPLPDNVPPAVLDASLVIVKAKPAAGRWRAGMKFTREESAISYRDLTEAQIAALTGDPELTVSLRVPSGGPG